jgi:hypothetical protein
MHEWGTLSALFPGWTLKEIMKMSPRERTNWLGLSPQLMILRK